MSNEKFRTLRKSALVIGVLYFVMGLGFVYGYFIDGDEDLFSLVIGVFSTIYSCFFFFLWRITDFYNLNIGLCKKACLPGYIMGFLFGVGAFLESYSVFGLNATAVVVSIGVFGVFSLPFYFVRLSLSRDQWGQSH